jgi:hypothetical protein
VVLLHGLSRVVLRLLRRCALSCAAAQAEQAVCAVQKWFRERFRSVGGSAPNKQCVPFRSECSVQQCGAELRTLQLKSSELPAA